MQLTDAEQKRVSAAADDFFRALDGQKISADQTHQREIWDILIASIGRVYFDNGCRWAIEEFRRWA